MKAEDALQAIARRLKLDESADPACVLAAFEKSMTFYEACASMQVRVANFLEIDFEAARKMPGKPSDVMITHILKRERAALEALLEEVYPDSNVGNILYDSTVEGAIDRLSAKIHQLETNPDESF